MNFYTLCYAKFRNIHENLCTRHLHVSKNKATAPIIFFKYNQQDATLYNILYYCQCSTCFRRFLRPSSGAQKLYTQHRVYAKLACCYRQRQQQASLQANTLTMHGTMNVNCTSRNCGLSSRAGMPVCQQKSMCNRPERSRFTEPFLGAIAK